MPIPHGDDVSAVDLGSGILGVLKTDMLVGKTDVPAGMTLQQAGRKAFVMNVSDFAAKGVKPLVALIAIGIPNHMKRKEIQEVAVGLKRAAKTYDVRIIGGDTNESDDLTIVTATFGICERERIVLRRGAQAGDLLAVSGRFGKTSAGLKILQENRGVPPKVRRGLIKAVCMPEARLDVGLKLKNMGATSSIDSSDGLAWSLHELSRASSVGFEVSTLPIAKEVKIFAEVHKLNPFNLVFYGGEEYELVVTLNPKHYARARQDVKKKMCIIGKAVDGRRLTYLKDGLEKPIKAIGWEHFKR